MSDGGSGEGSSQHHIHDELIKTRPVLVLTGLTSSRLEAGRSRELRFQLPGQNLSYPPDVLTGFHSVVSDPVRRSCWSDSR